MNQCSHLELKYMSVYVQISYHRSPFDPYVRDFVGVIIVLLLRPPPSYSSSYVILVGSHAAGFVLNLSQQ